MLHTKLESQSVMSRMCSVSVDGFVIFLVEHKTQSALRTAKQKSGI